MRILAFSVLTLGVGLVSIQLSACSNSADDCNATATCGATSGASHAGSAGKSGGGDEGGATSGGSVNGGSSNTSGSGAMGNGGDGGSGSNACTGDVSDDAACWTTNDLGVFVSSDNGDDTTGNGTKEAPFKTITKGIGASSGKNVYVCVGAKDYSEKISLSLATDGIHIYGGFECETWTYATTRSAQVVSPSNIALRIDGLKKGAYIENMAFTAADADGTGADASSYGAFVTESKSVVLKRVQLNAGSGAKGTDGEPGIKGPDGSAVGTEQNGDPALCVGTPEDGVPGKWLMGTCGSKGGNGGVGASDTNGANGFSGTPSGNVDPANVVNQGAGATVVGEDGVDGTKGSKGNPGIPGAPAADTGLFTVTGYAVANGVAGGDGFPGQGGGGGGASKGKGSPVCRGASGGAGGLGGCGGTPGKGGAGGGASIALFSWRSSVVLQSCQLASSTGGAGGAGGKGGSGGAGADGGSGGAGDVGNGIAKGGRGGSGGPGGNAGSGSGGTGGPSYTLVYADTKPVYAQPDTTISVDSGGPAGIGGQVLSAKAPDGFVGAAALEFEVK